MKSMINALARCLLGAGLAVFAIAFIGCGSVEHAAYDPINPPRPYAFPGQAGTNANALPVVIPSPVPNTQAPPVVAMPPGRPSVPENWQASTLRVGDFVNISFADIPPPGIVAQKTQIAEDGTITLPFNVRVQAIGKTPRALEQEIRGEFVPKYFRFLTVNVQTDQRAFFVGGEVKLASRLPYVGDMTVLRAIQSAGDFTDFANRKKIELRRDNGQTHTINWYKAIKNPKLDLPVYPNDQIIVHKRWF